MVTSAELQQAAEQLRQQQESLASSQQTLRQTRAGLGQYSTQQALRRETATGRVQRMKALETGKEISSREKELEETQKQISKAQEEIKAQQPIVAQAEEEQRTYEKVMRQFRREAEGKAGTILKTPEEKALYSKLYKENRSLREAAGTRAVLTKAATEAGLTIPEYQKSLEMTKALGTNVFFTPSGQKIAVTAAGATALQKEVESAIASGKYDISKIEDVKAIEKKYGFVPVTATIETQDKPVITGKIESAKIESKKEPYETLVSKGLSYFGSKIKAGLEYFPAFAKKEEVTITYPSEKRGTSLYSPDKGFYVPTTKTGETLSSFGEFGGQLATIGPYFIPYVGEGLLISGGLEKGVKAPTAKEKFIGSAEIVLGGYGLTYRVKNVQLAKDIKSAETRFVAQEKQLGESASQINILSQTKVGKKVYYGASRQVVIASPTNEAIKYGASRGFVMEGGKVYPIDFISDKFTPSKSAFVSLEAGTARAVKNVRGYKITRDIGEGVYTSSRIKSLRGGTIPSRAGGAYRAGKSGDVYAFVGSDKPRKVLTQRGLTIRTGKPNIRGYVQRKEEVNKIIYGPKEETLTFFHGTSDVFVPKISKEGLKPATQTGIKQGLTEARPFISVASTKEEAAGFATRAALKSQGKPVVLEISIPKSKIESLSVGAGEFRSGVMTEQRFQNIPKEYIKGLEVSKPKGLDIVTKKSISEQVAAQRAKALELAGEERKSLGLINVGKSIGGIKLSVPKQISKSDISIGETKTISKTTVVLKPQVSTASKQTISQIPSYRPRVETTSISDIAQIPKTRQTISTTPTLRQPPRQTQKIPPSEKIIEPTPQLIVPPSTKETKVSRLAEKLKQQETFEAFTKKLGKDISLGKARTQAEAELKLKTTLKGTLRAGGFITKGGKQLLAKQLKTFGGGEFAVSKVSPYRVIQKRERRLGTRTERGEIQYFKKTSKRSRSIFNL